MLPISNNVFKVLNIICSVLLGSLRCFFQFCGCIICHFPWMALAFGTHSVAPGAATWVCSTLLLGPMWDFSLHSHISFHFISTFYCISKKGLEWQGGTHRVWICRSTESCCPAGAQELGKLKQRKLGRDERGN